MSKANIGDVVAKTLAPTDAPEAVSGERTIENITSEILQLKTDAGNAIIGIGQRLNEAKELLPHGEWLPWLSDQVEFSERTAQDFMRLAREWSNPQTLADLGKSKALKLLLLPAAEREEFMEAHDVPNMSSRELEDAIRERDEAKKAAEHWESLFREEQRTGTETRKKLGEANWDLDEAKKENTKLQKQVKELETHKEVFQDEAAIQKAADEARKAADAEWSAKVKAAADKLAKAKEATKKAEEKAEQATKGAASPAELEAAKKAEAEAKAEAERLRAELEAAKREQAKATVSGDADLAAFQLLFESAQGEINKMRGILLKVRGRDEALAGKLTAALAALAEKVKECAK